MSFSEVLAALEAEQLLFVDRRKAKPRYYAWDSRPELPTAESVSRELVQFANSQFPLLCTPAVFKKHLGKARDKVALLENAIDFLTAGNGLVALRHRAGSKEVVLYAGAGALRERLEAASSAAHEEEVLISAYHELVGRTGYPAVTISELQRTSGCPIEEVKEWLLERHRSGHVVLSLGDWSLASEQERAAAIPLGGERYLQARLLE